MAGFAAGAAAAPSAPSAPAPSVEAPDAASEPVEEPVDEPVDELAAAAAVTEAEAVVPEQIVDEPVDGASEDPQLPADPIERILYLEFGDYPAVALDDDEDDDEDFVYEYDYEGHDEGPPGQVWAAPAEAVEPDEDDLAEEPVDVPGWGAAPSVADASAAYDDSTAPDGLAAATGANEGLDDLIGDVVVAPPAPTPTSPGAGAPVFESTRDQLASITADAARRAARR